MMHVYAFDGRYVGMADLPQEPEEGQEYKHGATVTLLDTVSAKLLKCHLGDTSRTIWALQLCVKGDDEKIRPPTDKELRELGPGEAPEDCLERPARRNHKLDTLVRMSWKKSVGLAYEDD